MTDIDWELRKIYDRLEDIWDECEDLRACDLLDDAMEAIAKARSITQETA